jgi:hypothetical protein
MYALLSEGFSIKTLESFDKNQIDVLYERVKKSNKKETKEQTTTGTVQPKVSNKTVKQIELPVGAETTATGKVTVQNDAGKTVITQTEGEVTEKAVSKKQQKAMGVALAAKRGDIPKSKLKGSSKEMVKMSEKDLKDFASTKHKGLPEKKKKETVKNLEESIMKLIENHLNPEVKKSDLLKMIRKN